MKKTLSTLLAVALLASMLMALLPVGASAKATTIIYRISCVTVNNVSKYYVTVVYDSKNQVKYGPYDTYAQALDALESIQLKHMGIQTTTLRQNPDTTSTGGAGSISGVSRGAVKNNNYQGK